LERAGDMIGAVVGPLAALTLLAVGVALPGVLLLAVVPGLLAAVCVAALVKERAHDSAAPSRAALRPAMPDGFWPLIGAILLFGLGDFSRSFLILAVAKASPVADDGGAALFGLPVLLYAAHNGISALATFPSGHLADRFGRRRVLAAGYALGLGVNLTLALASRSLAAVAFAFALSGRHRRRGDGREGQHFQLLPRESFVRRARHGQRDRRRGRPCPWGCCGIASARGAVRHGGGVSAAGLLLLAIVSAPTAPG
jgi:MFS family permease